MLNKTVVRKLVVAAIVAQIAVLLFMASKRETIIATGEEIYLRSAPIDPRDPFRGDFVRLSYELNRIPNQYYQGEKELASLHRDTVLYTVLQHEENNVYRLNYFTETKPHNAIYIKGRLNNRRQFQSVSKQFTNIKYGIEQYYVQQGKSLEMEKRMGNRGTLQIPLEMQVAIGSDGTPVIKGHRWSQLGMQLEFVRSTNPRRSEGQAPISPIINMTLANVSNQPLNIANNAENCAFSLILVDNDHYEENVDSGCSRSNAENFEAIHLQPGEEYSVELDFSLPRWHVDFEGMRVEVGAIEDWRRYRLRYRPAITEGLWLGTLDSPLFNTNGRTD